MSEQPLTTDAGDAIAFDVVDPFLWHVTAEASVIDDQDHVNHAAYVKWMGKAAFAHSAALGYDWPAYQKLGASFVVRRHEVDYLAPAFAGDRIVVATWPCAMQRFTAFRRYQMVRQSDGQTLVRARTKWVYLDLRTGRPRRMPDELIAGFQPRED